MLRRWLRRRSRGSRHIPSRAPPSENLSQINLSAMGIRIPGINPIIGPFGFFDTRAYFSQTIFNYSQLLRERGAAANEQASRYNYKDARDLVVLAVGNAYLQAIAGAARVATAQAQVQTAQALYGTTAEHQKAGVSAATDPLRGHGRPTPRKQR